VTFWPGDDTRVAQILILIAVTFYNIANYYIFAVLTARSMDVTDDSRVRINGIDVNIVLENEFKSITVPN
jgi:hypothetical protein